MVILTCGAVGSYVFHAGGTSYLDTPAVQVADTVGAGDSFTGAFVACILAGRGVEEAHRTAVDVSAYVCTQTGAMPPMPEGMTRF
jgi:fructokinase